MRDFRNKPSDGAEGPDEHGPGQVPYKEDSDLDSLRMPQNAAKVFRSMLDNPGAFGSGQIAAAVEYFSDHFHFVTGYRKTEAAIFEEPSQHPAMRDIYKFEVRRSEYDPGIVVHAACQRMAVLITDHLEVDLDFIKQNLYSSHIAGSPIPMFLEQGQSVSVSPDVLHYWELGFSRPFSAPQEWKGGDWTDYRVAYVPEQNGPKNNIAEGMYLSDGRKLMQLTHTETMFTDAGKRVGSSQLPGYNVKISCDKGGVVRVSNGGPAAVALDVTYPFFRSVAELVAKHLKHPESQELTVEKSGPLAKIVRRIITRWHKEN